MAASLREYRTFMSTVGDTAGTSQIRIRITELEEICE